MRNLKAFGTKKIIEFAEMELPYHGILEETAGTADNGRVGKFGSAYLLYLRKHLTNGGIAAELFRKPAQGPVRDIPGFKRGPEFETDTKHIIAVFPFMLEHTVAISKAAFVMTKGDSLASECVEALYGMDKVTGFDAIGSHILHGSGTYLTGDIGKILQSGQTLGNTPIYKSRPILGGSGYNVDCIGILIISHDTFDTGVKNETFEIVYKKEIATTSYMEHIIIKPLRGTGNLKQFPFRCVFGEDSGLHRDAERGERGDILIIFKFH